MELQKYVPQLNEVIAQAGALAVPSAVALWEAFEVGGNVSDVGKAALAHFFFTSTDDEGVPVWKSAQIARDEHGELRLCAQTWPEFCLVHLGMDKTTVSSYHRVWQVFHEELHYSLEELIGAGVFKLKVSVGLVAKMLKEFGVVDERIKVGLFGSVQGEAPLSADQMWFLVKTLKEELFGEAEDKEEGVDFLGSVEAVYDESDNVIMLRLLADYRMGDRKVILPVWEIGVVDDDAGEQDFGIRRQHLSQFRTWLGKRFPGVG